MNSILQAILLQLNPLLLPISGLLYYILRSSLGPDVDPAYRAPEPEDAARIAFIEKYVRDGQPIADYRKYLLYCSQMGADPESPFHDSHPLASETIL